MEPYMAKTAHRNDIIGFGIIKMMVIFGLFAAFTLEMVCGRNTPHLNSTIGCIATYNFLRIFQSVSANAFAFTYYTFFALIVSAMGFFTFISPFIFANGLTMNFFTFRSGPIGSCRCVLAFSAPPIQTVFGASRFMKVRYRQNMFAFGAILSRIGFRHSHSFQMSMLRPFGTHQAATFVNSNAVCSHVNKIRGGIWYL